MTRRGGALPMLMAALALSVPPEVGRQRATPRAVPVHVPPEQRHRHVDERPPVEVNPTGRAARRRAARAAKRGDA